MHNHDSGFVIISCGNTIVMHQRPNNGQFSLLGGQQNAGSTIKQSIADHVWNQFRIMINPSLLKDAGWHTMGTIANEQSPEMRIYNLDVPYMINYQIEDPQQSGTIYCLGVREINHFANNKKINLFHLRAILRNRSTDQTTGTLDLPQGESLDKPWRGSYGGLKWAA